MNKKDLIKVLTIGCLLVFALSASAFAVGKVKASGLLTSVEDDGTVIIDGVGYLVSRSVIVRDQHGTSISLRNISLPHNVNFEYEYAPKGFMIILIKEAAG